MKSHNDTVKGQNEIGMATINDIRKDAFFNNDIFTNPLEKSLFAYSRKIEKVVTALYLVTDVMDSELPLTRSLRLESLDLLNACYQVLTAAVINPSELTRVLVRLEHVTSLVSIGRISHHISEMNAQVLIAELQKVSQMVAIDTQELQQKYSSYLYPRSHGKDVAQPILSHTTLDDKVFDDIEKNKKRQNVSYRPINDIKSTLTTQKQEGKAVSNINIDKIVNTSEIKTTLKIGTDNESRKQGILNVIRSHRNASMQDIQKFVTGCSDKTLQRELAGMIAAGTIRKEGDKRWATYHIV